MDMLTGPVPEGPALTRVHYWHDQIIDCIIANPGISQGEVAAKFGYSQTWMSIMVNSDAFKERLAERRDELVDPVIRASLEEKLHALADISIKTLIDKLTVAPDARTANAALKTVTTALGYGARQQPPQQANQFVVIVPPTEASSLDWERRYSSQPGTSMTFEAPPGAITSQGLD